MRDSCGFDRILLTAKSSRTRQLYSAALCLLATGWLMVSLVAPGGLSSDALREASEPAEDAELARVIKDGYSTGDDDAWSRKLHGDPSLSSSPPTTQTTRMALLGSAKCDKEALSCSSVALPNSALWPLPNPDRPPAFLEDSNFYCLRRRHVVASLASSARVTDQPELHSLRLSQTQAIHERTAHMLDRSLRTGLVPPTTRMFLGKGDAPYFHHVHNEWKHVVCSPIQRKQEPADAEEAAAQAKEALRKAKDLASIGEVDVSTQENALLLSLSDECVAVQQRPRRGLKPCTFIRQLKPSSAKVASSSSLYFSDQLRLVSKIAKSGKCGRRGALTDESVLESLDNGAIGDADDDEETRAVLHPHSSAHCELALQLSDSVILDTLMGHTRRSFQVNCRVLTMAGAKGSGFRVFLNNFDDAHLELNIPEPGSSDKPSLPKSDMIFRVLRGGKKASPTSNGGFVALVRGRTVALVRRLARTRGKELLRALHKESDECHASPGAALYAMNAVQAICERADALLAFWESRLGRGVRVY